MLPPLSACGLRARPALFVLAWTGDRSPIRGCTTTSGDQVPPRTHGGSSPWGHRHWGFDGRLRARQRLRTRALLVPAGSSPGPERSSSRRVASMLRSGENVLGLECPCLRHEPELRAGQYRLKRVRRYQRPALGDWVRSNSPLRTPPRNASHSAGVKPRITPLASLLLRTRIRLLDRPATSTQLPFA